MATYFEMYKAIEKFLLKPLSENLIKARKKRCRLLQPAQKQHEENYVRSCPCQHKSECQVPNVREHD